MKVRCSGCGTERTAPLHFSRQRTDRRPNRCQAERSWVQSVPHRSLSSPSVEVVCVGGQGAVFPRWIRGCLLLCPPPRAARQYRWRTRYSCSLYLRKRCLSSLSTVSGGFGRVQVRSSGCGVERFAGCAAQEAETGREEPADEAGDCQRGHGLKACQGWAGRPVLALKSAACDRRTIATVVTSARQAPQPLVLLSLRE